ncbi:MAG TPA: hypothetical protein VG204_01065 [Terriglobia bacterium]|nr:hypothetical protein [Terriglobia bacterium]
MMIAKSARAVMAAIVLAVMLVPPLAAAPADGRHPGTKLTGVVTAVDPAHLRLRGDNGRQVTLETSDDYTQRLAVGAEVTAWYSSKGGANTLEWLDGPRDSFFVPAEEIRRRIRKVVILPESSVPGADPLFDAMQNYLETRAGWYVAARRLVAEVLSAALKSQAAASPSRPLSSTLGAINPETGEFDMAAYERGAAPTQAQTEAKGQAKAPPAAPAGPAAQASSTLDAINPATGEFDMTRYAPDEPAKQDSRGGKPAATASQAQTAAAAPAASPLDAIDPATGNFDMTRYLQAQAAAQTVASGVAPSRPTDDPRLVARVASLIRVDGVLEAQVVQVQAPVSRLVAKWDGAEEPIGGKGSETVAHLALAARHGSVPAATVVLKLWDSQGNLLWTDRTGFAVLAVHEGLRNAMRERPLAEVLNNRATLDQWMNGVFSPLLADHTSTSATSRKR